MWGDRASVYEESDEGLEKVEDRATSSRRSSKDGGADDRNRDGNPHPPKLKTGDDPAAVKAWVRKARM